jgi:hypothetical protein
MESYDNSWREFVSTHEKYLDVIDSENENEAAYSLYEEQIKRKFEFGCMIKSWRGEGKSEGKCRSCFLFESFNRKLSFKFKL